MNRRATLAVAGFALVFAAGVVAARQSSGPVPEAGWQAFAGTWSVSGRRHEIAVDGGATAVIVEVAGPVVLAEGGDLGRGFRGEAIAFSDGRGLNVGRCVWTDERGDRLFSRLTGEPVVAGKRLVGTFDGGTGRYAGWEGEYELTWQYVVADEDGRFQGRGVGLTGRVRQAGGPR